ncbi:MAG: 50S ribosomal protein L29 [Planctomycetota bacterium]|nr:50S ribosomal protein L29 [Planctomycetota bacterium]
MKAKDLREKSSEELRAQLLQVKRSLFDFYLKGASGEKVDPGQKRTARRDIARILTVLRERDVRRDLEKRESELEAAQAAGGRAAGKGKEIAARQIREIRRLKAAIVREDPGLVRDA